MKTTLFAKTVVMCLGLAAAGVTPFGSHSAQAQTAVNIDIQAATGRTTYVGTAVPVTGTTWNGSQFGPINTTLTGLVSDTNAATDTQLRFLSDPSEFAYNPAGTPTAEALMDDYSFIDNAGSTSTNTLAIQTNAFDGIGAGLALTAGSLWDIYIYSQGDTATHGGVFTVNGSGPAVATGTAPWAGTFVQGGNYVLFSGVSPQAYVNSPTDTGFEFRIAWSDEAGEQFSAFNGFQLVQVPEPTTWTMLLGGLGMLLGFQRRRRFGA